MFADSRTYPAMTIAGMYRQEQELAKADERGLIITAVDLAVNEVNPCKSCHLNDGETCISCIYE